MLLKSAFPLDMSDFRAGKEATTRDAEKARRYREEGTGTAQFLSDIWPLLDVKNRYFYCLVLSNPVCLVGIERQSTPGIQEDELTEKVLDDSGLLFCVEGGKQPLFILLLTLVHPG